MAYKLLIISDEPPINDSLANALGSAGYRVNLAQLGNVDVEMIASECCPDLVLVLAAELNAAAARPFCQRLKALVTGYLPVVYSSPNFSNASWRIQALENDADAVLPSPFEIPELLAQMQALLHSRKKSPLRALAENANPASFGGIPGLLVKLLDGFPYFISVKDLQGHYVMINKQLSTLAGLPPESIIGRTDAELFPKEKFQIFQSGEELLLKTGSPQTQESEIIAPDGTKLILSTNKFLFFDDQGSPVNLCSISRDITELKKAEAITRERVLESEERAAALKTSEERFRAFMDHGPFFAFIKNAAGEYIYGNRRYEHAFLHGIPGAWKEKTDNELWDPLHASRVQAADKKVFKTGFPIIIEEQLPKPDGSLVDLVMVKFPIKGEKNTAFIGGIGLDISEIKRAETALQESEWRFQTIFDNAVDGFMIHDESGNLLAVNQALCQMLGYSRHELLTLRLSDFVLPEQAFSVMKQVLQTGRLCYEASPRRRDGAVISVECICMVLQAGNKKRIFSMVRDITERKRSTTFTNALNALLKVFPQKKTSQQYLDAVVALVSHWSGCRCVSIRTSKPRMYESNRGSKPSFCTKNACNCYIFLSKSPHVRDQQNMTAAGSFYCANVEDFLASCSPADLRYYQGNCFTSGYNSVALIPLWHQGDILGVIHLGDEQRGRLTPDALQLVESMAPLIAEAFAKLSIELELVWRAETQTALAALMRLSLESSALETVLEKFMAFVLSIPWQSIGNCGALYLFDRRDSLLILAAQHGLTGEDVPQSSRLPAMLIQVDNDDESLPVRRYAPFSPGGPETLCVPLRSAVGILGMLRLVVGANPNPEGKELESLKTLADSLAIIIEHKRAEETLKKSERRFQSLAQISPVGIFRIEENGDLVYSNDHYLQITGLTQEECMVKGWIRCLHPEDRETVLENWENAFKKQLPYKRELRVLRPDGVVLWVCCEAIPLHDSNKAFTGFVGTLTNITDSKRIAEQLKAYADRLECVTRQLIDAQETERRHIARELHDDIGQVLSAVHVNLLHVQRRSRSKTLAARIEKSLAVVERAIQQVRSLSLGLRPSMLDDFGLNEALKWQIGELSQHVNFKIHFTPLSTSVRLPSPVEIVCFRLVQESLTNVTRHAQASLVSVTLELEAGQVAVSIRDNGVGFDLNYVRNRAKNGECSGIIGMEERVRQAGGTLSFELLPHQGTLIHAKIPVPLTPPAPS